MMWEACFPEVINSMRTGNIKWKELEEALWL
jgi:hypothetical protein